MKPTREHQKPKGLTNVAIAALSAIAVLAVVVLMCGVGGVFLGYSVLDVNRAPPSAVTDVAVDEAPAEIPPADAARAEAAGEGVAGEGVAGEGVAGEEAAEKEPAGPANQPRDSAGASPEVEAARTAMRVIQQQLEIYRLDVGSYPSEQQGLNALLVCPADLPQADAWNGPYARNVPSDPWGLLYSYQHVAPDGYRLVSGGPDNVTGTSDDLVVERGGETPEGPDR